MSSSKTKPTPGGVGEKREKDKQRGAKHTTREDYEEFKRRVIAQEHNRRRKSDTPKTDQEGNEAAVLSWLHESDPKTQKKQHYEKTVHEIDMIMDELKEKGVPEPKEDDHAHTLIPTLHGTAAKRRHHKSAEAQRTKRTPSPSPGEEEEAEIDEQSNPEDEMQNLSLDDPRKKWNEATKTRYVRAKEPRNIEIVLSNDEIFGKDKDKEDNTGWWKSFCQQSTTTIANNGSSSSHEKQGKGQGKRGKP